MHKNGMENSADNIIVSIDAPMVSPYLQLFFSSSQPILKEK